eukprot:6212544-Pleurochrysis_carterae.AAC.2
MRDVPPSPVALAKRPSHNVPALNDFTYKYTSFKELSRVQRNDRSTRAIMNDAAKSEGLAGIGTPVTATRSMLG